MLHNIEKKLKEAARINPLTKTEKNILWTKIESKISQHQILRIFGLKPKFVFASFMSFVLITASAVAVGASNDAGPGDLLYPIDIAIERIELALSRENNKDNLRLKFAQERLKEAQKALAFQNNNDLENITISTSTENNFKRIQKADKTLPSALEKLEKTKELLEQKGNEKAVERVNEIIEKLTNLAQDHVSDLDELEIEINDDNGRKQQIKAFREKIKIKFKLNHLDNKEKVVICHIPSDNPDNAHTIEIAEPALQAHLAHGDYLRSCNHEYQGGYQDNDDDDNTTSTPDITAPVISNINSSVSTNTADITWDTDESSDSVVWYNTTTSVIISGDTLYVSSSTLVIDHNISLSDLNASTTYYFILSSTDEFNNEATSTELSFITL
ncbi:MAG: DUF5667 domain-containing protein [Candidatus Nealsonbacteria bacterium]